LLRQHVQIFKGGRKGHGFLKQSDGQR